MSVWRRIKVKVGRHVQGQRRTCYTCCTGPYNYAPIFLCTRGHAHLGTCFITLVLSSAPPLTSPSSLIYLFPSSKYLSLFYFHLLRHLRLHFSPSPTHFHSPFPPFITPLHIIRPILQPFSPLITSNVTRLFLTVAHSFSLSSPVPIPLHQHTHTSFIPILDPFSLLVTSDVLHIFLSYW